MSDTDERPEHTPQELDDLDDHIYAEQQRLDGMKRTADGLRKRADAMDERREAATDKLRVQRMVLKQGRLENELYEMRQRIVRLEAELEETREKEEKARGNLGTDQPADTGAAGQR